MSGGMDAKPFRGRGVENIVSSLHQRHKSTGNLKSEAQVGGFRGPAKRSAFGDVTNTARGHSNTRDEAKVIKSRASVAVLQTHTATNRGKENNTEARDPQKKLLQRPATSAGLRTKTSLKPLKAVAQQDAPEDSFVDLQAVDEGDMSVDSVPAENHESWLSRPLQPRHFKSHPYLRKPQSLRRTASGLLDKHNKYNSSEPTPAADGDAVLLSSEDLSTTDALPISDSAVNTEANESSVMCSIDRRNPSHPLPHIPEGDMLDQSPNLSHEALGSLSEPEEYWDELEDYDDDQNYTTAHSFKSKDLTTGGATTVLAPRVSKAVQRELEEAKREVERTRVQEDVDLEAWDISMVTEYGDDIFEYMRELEISMAPNPHYMDAQTEIQWSMRSVLMDWLVQVHGRFNLLPETLFLTVNYIDRFLSNKIVSISRLQLVGATAILVASKYEEIHCPCISEIIYMVDGGYSTDELLKAERFMLNMLDYKLGWPGPMSFLRRVSKGDDYDIDTRTMAKYFLELTIMDERFVASPPSYLAAGAHCLARLIQNKGEWTQPHTFYSGYTWNQLKPLVVMMIECCKHPQDHHSAIFDKYSHSRLKYVSLEVQDRLDAGFTLPHQSAPVRNTPGI